jgi:hypothetical protein
MTLSNIRATLGLNATATLGAAGTSGGIVLGQSNRTLNLSSTTNGYHLQAVFANASDTVTLALASNTTSSATTWAAGAAQVETATAAGTVSAGGNAEVVVTAAGMTGSPKTLAVAVATSDTATLWAAKVRAALAADADVSAMFTVSGATTAIVLTRKPTHTFTVPGGTLPIYAANDGTLNIALATGTATGITTAATSTNTTSGTASDGVKLYDNGGDLEGVAVSLTNLYGVQYALTGDAAIEVSIDGNVADYMRITGGEVLGKANTSPIATDANYVLTASGACSLAITVFGA